MSLVFFSSRRRHTRYWRDWSSDVCSSDLGKIQPDLVSVAVRSDAGWGLATQDEALRPATSMEGLAALKTPFRPHGRVTAGNRSEERRVGKECRSRWSPYH